MELTAGNLKTALWETLNKVRSGECSAAQAHAVSGTAREILRTTKLQLQITQQSERSVPVDVISFAEK